MKRFLVLLIPLVWSSLACAVSVGGGTTDSSGPCPDADLPCVVFLAPTVGDTYALGVPILLHAQAQDSGTGIAKIEFYDNFEAVIGSVAASNPQGDPTLNAIVAWDAPSAQTHFVYVQAFRADGTASPRKEISVQVVQPPAGVTLPSPAAPNAAVTPTTEGTSSNQTGAANAQNAESSSAALSAPSPEAALSTGQGGGEVLTESSATESADQAVTTTTLTAVVAVSVANVRVSPDLQADIASSPVVAGTNLELVFRSPDNQWAAIALAGGGYGWIFIPNTLTVNGDLTTLPTATP